jgi:hypothetical protein
MTIGGEEVEEGIDMVFAIELREDILCLCPTLLLLGSITQLPRIIVIRPVDIGLQFVYLVGEFHLKAISSPI